LLLRAYPREFRARFSSDLEADFATLLARRGRVRAWRLAISDLTTGPLTPTPIARSSGGSVMGSLLFDMRHAARSLVKSPAFTVVTILTLALGIGANSAIFTLVNAVLLRPLGYHEPERLLLVHEAIPESGVPRFDVSPADYIDLISYQTSFSTIGAYRTRLLELSGSGEPEQVPGTELTASVFAVLGVAPARGRVFLADEDQQPSQVAVISERLRARRFSGRDPIGERLLLDRQPYTIIGVMPASFEFPKRGATSNAEPADVWLPLWFNPFERQARGMFYNHTVIGRLRDGITPEQATADLAPLARRIQDNYPPQIRNAFTLTIGSRLMTEEISGQVRRPLLVLLCAVGLVLFVACANVANLILSRSVVREREIGVRAALGAGTLRLFQVLLLEALILAVAGGALGLALAYWAVRAVPAVLVTSLPGVSDVAIDWRVIAFTAGLSMASAVAFALVPLIAGSRRDLQEVVHGRSGRTTASRRQRHAQAVMVVTSVAFAFVLLVGAGLLIRSFRALVAVDQGLRAERVLSMQVRLPPAGYNSAPRIRGFYQTLTEQLRTLPGVTSAAIATDLPLEADGERRVFTPETTSPRGLQPSVAVTWVHGDYFGTYGVTLLQGRNFSADELREDRRVAIVSKRIADSYWPGEDPIGKRLKWGIPASTAPWKTVIGVVGDVAEGPPGSVPVIHIYVPFTDVPDAAIAAPLAGLLRRMVIAIRSEQEPQSLTAAARSMVAALDPSLAVTDVQTITDLERNRSAPQRFSAVVLTGFAAGTLLLAAIGLYGVLSFAVSQRRQEIGVRMALGAQPREVLRLVVRQGMVLVIVGLVAGGLTSLAAVRFVRAQLFETNVHDPMTFVSVPLVLAIVGLAACYLPARRAAHVDPTVALRTE
jgi:putative ABC transport system permease protein